jgi:aspartate/methionine/tyrosine aminotransferase
MPLIGSKEGIMHISMAFVNPGDEVLVPDPGYPTYSSATTLTGGVVRNYDLLEKNRWLPDLSKIEDGGMEKVKAMWVNYPHMPSGAKGTTEFFERLVRFADRHNILLCNDNPYSFILNKEYLSILSVDGAKETAIELNSLSKSHNMAGWRIGMAASNSDYITTVLRVKSNMDSGMFLPVQMAAAEALGNDEGWYDDVNKTYRDRRRIAEEIMNTIKCTFDKEQTGLFLWGRLPGDKASCEKFSDDLLLGTGVFITPGFIFGKNGSGYIRISLCSTAETLEKAKTRVKEFLGSKTKQN